MQEPSWLRPVVFPLKKGGLDFFDQDGDVYQEHVKKVDSTNLGVRIYPDSTGDVIPLNVILAGSNFWNRIGNKIHLRKLTFRGFETIDVGRTGVQAAHGFAGYGGYVIAYDHQPNGVTPVWRDLMEDVDENGNTTITPDAFSSINWGNRDRFEILFDSRRILPEYNVDPMTSQIVDVIYPEPSTMDASYWVEIDLNGKDTIFNTSNSGTAADIMTGALWLFSFGTEPAADNDIYLQWRTRLYFEDF